MTDPDSPPVTDAKKGRFQPGNKFGRGRPKGSENKFGPGFRERVLAGIARSGTKKANKAGTNRKVDGIEYYLEHLADTNGAATASIIAKLIPPEQPPQPESSMSPMIVNIRSVAEGSMFAPGNTVLLPLEEAAKAWSAYRAGGEAWRAYLQEVEPQLTKAAIENLSRVVAPKPDNVVPLRTSQPDNDKNDDADIATDDSEVEPPPEAAG